MFIAGQNVEQSQDENILGLDETLYLSHEMVLHHEFMLLFWHANLMTLLYLKWLEFRKLFADGNFITCRRNIFKKGGNCNGGQLGSVAAA